MSNRTCEKCNATFRDASTLRRHLARKTPCEPILEPVEGKSGKVCRFCGRGFTTLQARSRHIKFRCKIANSDEGMEKLMEHTLQRQLAELRTQNTRMEAQVAELATLMRGQATLIPAPSPRPADSCDSGSTRIAVGSVTNNVCTTTVTQNVQINIRPAVPWDGERRIDVSVAQIAAAFAENARLREYTHLEGRLLTDPDVAPPYVAELLMDLTKRAHSDPAARNVYLNPKRADQALVHMATGKWEVLPLLEATRLIFDGVAKAMMRVTMGADERRKLPLEAQNALAIAGLMYDDEPEGYAKKAKAPMSAHLANTTPALCAS